MLTQQGIQWIFDALYVAFAYMKVAHRGFKIVMVQ